jgi:hypothetical protein
MRALLALLAASQFLAAQGHAQIVRGTAITPDSALVPGVIVTLVDSMGTPVARALADDGGAFTVRAPASGTYRIEAKRLAFHPTLGDPIVLHEGKILRYVIVLTGAPVELATVRVRAETQCGINPDSLSAAYAVWEEARKALRASQLTRMTRAYKVDVTTFVRRQSAAEQRWRITDSSSQVGMSLRPFTSRPAEELAERGYLTRGANREVYHAPDEDVLLSESFAATHCLRLLSDSGGQDVARLRFAPVPGRRQADIAGVLTIDRATSELRRLDFSYVHLPVMDVVGAPGGEIVFRRLPEGSWLIEQWAIWLPVVELRSEYPPSITPPTARGMPARPVPLVSTRFGLQTTGGRVTRVTFGDETLWLKEAERVP